MTVGEKDCAPPGEILSSSIPDEKVLVNPGFWSGLEYWSDPDVLTLLF